MDAETGFDINGTIYPVPPLDTFDMDEAQVLYDYSGLTLEDFAEDADETPQDREERERKLKNPGLMRALMHVTYQRRHRELKRQDVERLIGSANILQAYATLSADVEDDESLPGADDRSAAIIRERLGRFEHEFWQRFIDRFGRTGLDPASYWDYQIGHILPGITPENIGRMRPIDLLGAAQLFDAKYMGDDG